VTYMARLTSFIKTYFTGVVAAIISTVFAGYMLVNGQVSEDDFDIVVRHNPVISPLKGKLTNSSVPKQWQPKDVAPVVSDQILTGSIPRQVDKLANRDKKQDMRRVIQNQVASGPSSYVVRIATEQLALVEGGGKLWNVRPGGLLPGSGRVLQIKRRGKKWVVVTTHGEIK